VCFNVECERERLRGARELVWFCFMDDWRKEGETVEVGFGDRAGVRLAMWCVGLVVVLRIAGGFAHM
jgi:hypothetical protein